MRQSPARRAFTLIELLVVMAIIAILAAILYPVFAQVKAAAKKAVCMSNEKQLGLGFASYFNDFDDVLPLSGEIQGANKGAWVGNGHLSTMPACSNLYGGLDLCSVADPTQGGLWPYVKNKGVYRCPTEQTGRYKFTGAPVDSSNQWVTYTMNIYDSGLPASSMVSTSNTALIVDEDVTTRNNGSFMPCFGVSGYPDAPTCTRIADEFGNQHSAGADMLFCDMHAKSRKKNEFAVNSPAHRVWFPTRTSE